MFQKKIIYDILISSCLKLTSNQRDEIKHAKLGCTNEKLLVENLWKDVILMKSNVGRKIL